MRASSVMLPASSASFPRRAYPPLVAAPPRRGSGRRIYQALRQARQSCRGLQRSRTPADTQRVRPRLLALVLALLLAACGGEARPVAAPPRDEQVGTADVERLLVSTQRRRSPNLKVGAATCPDQVPLANGTRFTCTVLIEGTKAPYAVTLRDVDAAKATGRFALAPAKPIIDVSRIRPEGQRRGPGPRGHGRGPRLGARTAAGGASGARAGRRSRRRPRPGRTAGPGAGR
jgi:hypothetical protein